MPLTPTPGDQRTQQLAEVNPICLRPTAAPIDLHARRVNHKALDAARLEEAREPNRIVAEYDRRLLATHLRCWLLQLPRSADQRSRAVVIPRRGHLPLAANAGATKSKR